jgi:hypothetical protein
MSIKPIFDTSGIYGFSCLKERINEYCDKLEAKKYTKMVVTRENGSFYNVDFTYDKKFGNIQAYRNVSDDYDHIVFNMKSKNITFYNYLFSSFSLATPLFAIAYFGTVITPVADWIQGQLRSDQIGQIRAQYSSKSSDNNSDSLGIDSMFQKIVRLSFNPFRRHLTIGNLEIDL